MYGIDKSNEPFFVWASTHELPTATTDPYWGTLYKTIFYANSVLGVILRSVFLPKQKKNCMKL